MFIFAWNDVFEFTFKALHSGSSEAVLALESPSLRSLTLTKTLSWLAARRDENPLSLVSEPIHPCTLFQVILRFGMRNERLFESQSC